MSDKPTDDKQDKDIQPGQGERGTDINQDASEIASGEQSPRHLSEQSQGQDNQDNQGNDPWTKEPAKETGNESTKNEKIETDQKASTGNGEWQHDLINRLAFASLNEQRRSRRWNVFFKSLFFVYLFIILFMYIPDKATDISIGKHTALIELNGVIASDSFANADSVITGLRAAFKDKNTRGIIIRINSPGGSPVQAAYINDEIYRLKDKYPDVPVYAVVTDMAASAAYYIAVAADEIYADKGSIVGSIGVLADGFGFVDSMKKLGVERRLMTAGENKGMLDPFSPTNPKHKRHMQGLLDNVHEQFIDVVKKGRGDRLKDNPDIFTGLFWTGEHSVSLGLIDGLASSSQVARDVIGVEKIVDFTPRPNYFDQFAERFGVAMANKLGTVMSGPTLR